MNNFKEKYSNHKLDELALAFKKLKEAHADLKAQAATIWAEVDYLRFDAIPVMMEDDNISNCIIEKVGRLSTRVEASVKTKDKEKLGEWLHEVGADELFTETINSSSLKSFIMNRIKDGGDIPGLEIIEFNPYTVATLAKV